MRVDSAPAGIFAPTSSVAGIRISRAARAHACAGAFIFSLMNPNVTSILGGYSDRAQLEELVKVSEMAPLDAAELGQIDGVYARNFDLTTVAKP